MQIDVSIVPIGACAADIVATAREAERLGFDGVTIFDELCDVTGGGTWSHEPWTLLSGIATTTDRISLGTLVLNVANRDPGTFAVAAATLQDLSGGRLWIGLGAGTGVASPFSADQRALGRRPVGAVERRENLRRHIAAIRAVWSDEEAGFLTPRPKPPLIVGAFGLQTAIVAGEVADGIAAPISSFGAHGASLEALVATARAAFAASGRSGIFHVVAHHGMGDPIEDPQWRSGSALYERLEELGADRLVLETPARPGRLSAAARALPLPTAS